MACRALESRLTYLCVKEQTTSSTPETHEAPEGGPMECNRAPQDFCESVPSPTLLHVHVKCQGHPLGSPSEIPSLFPVTAFF